MLVKDFLRQLSLTRMKNTAAVDLGQATGIKANFLESFIYYLNESLTNIYTEFRLLKKSCLLQLNPPYTEYYIRKEYALTDPTEVIFKYIRDTEDYPFYPYLIRVTNILNGCGCDVLINDSLNCLSTHTIEFDCIQFSHLNVGEFFTIVYLADHIPLTVANVATDVINIPPIMFELLKYLIASKYYFDLGKNSAEAQNNLIQYNELGKNIIRNNSIPDFQDSNYYLEQKGFV